ncbi:putative toxin-antitoxin system toxin component, PIN family [Polynucleobacter acidiphobus]|uniref:putative toxin-antitoxin system toxin component, PIN family n=1 Tax=Polynucleobacter acidiphobus TaxID=556053 RepID=UPI000D339484|nr:putative toxin-antitoxin system toxin component, PIN family [Polynucleobacter acidiphobus]
MAIKTLVLDTNIVLDLLVFQDPRADWIRDGIAQDRFELIYSSEMLLELADVIARPQFAQNSNDQSTLLSSWTQMAIHKPTPPRCSFRCDDPDDQAFIDLAYHYRPSQLLSKDRKVLQMQRALGEHGVWVQSYPD